MQQQLQTSAVQDTINPLTHPQTPPNRIRERSATATPLSGHQEKKTIEAGSNIPMDLLQTEESLAHNTEYPTPGEAAQLQVNQSSRAALQRAGASSAAQVLRTTRVELILLALCTPTLHTIAHPCARTHFCYRVVVDSCSSRISLRPAPAPRPQGLWERGRSANAHIRAMPPREFTPGGNSAKRMIRHTDARTGTAIDTTQNCTFEITQYSCADFPTVTKKGPLASVPGTRRG